MVRTAAGTEWRLSPVGHLLYRLSGRTNWEHFARETVVKIAVDLASSPYIEVPDPEDGPA